MFFEQYILDVLIGDVHRVDEIIPGLLSTLEQLFMIEFFHLLLFWGQGVLNFLKLLVRLLDFEVCSDSLLCLYPLLHGLESENALILLLFIIIANRIHILSTKPHTVLFSFIKLFGTTKRLELSNVEH